MSSSFLVEAKVRGLGVAFRWVKPAAGPESVRVRKGKGFDAKGAK
jgi:hypothetical protein